MPVNLGSHARTPLALRLNVSLQYRHEIARSRFKQPSDRFDSLAIRAEVGVTDARGGANVNDRRCFIEQELHVIDEPQEWRREFDVKIRLIIRDDSRARLLRHESDQSLKCLAR